MLISFFMLESWMWSGTYSWGHKTVNNSAYRSYSLILVNARNLHSPGFSKGEYLLEWAECQNIVFTLSRWMWFLVSVSSNWHVQVLNGGEFLYICFPESIWKLWWSRLEPQHFYNIHGLPPSLTQYAKWDARRDELVVLLSVFSTINMDKWSDAMYISRHCGNFFYCCATHALGPEGKVSGSAIEGPFIDLWDAVPCVFIITLMLHCLDFMLLLVFLFPQ